jgi:hypothetical protein
MFLSKNPLFTNPLHDLCGSVFQNYSKYGETKNTEGQAYLPYSDCFV